MLNSLQSHNPHHINQENNYNFGEEVDKLINIWWYKIPSIFLWIKSSKEITDKFIYNSNGKLHASHIKINELLTWIRKICDINWLTMDSLDFLHFLYYSQDKSIKEIYDILAQNWVQPYNHPSSLNNLFKKLEWKTKPINKEKLSKKNDISTKFWYQKQHITYNDLATEFNEYLSIDFSIRISEDKYKNQNSTIKKIFKIVALLWWQESIEPKILLQLSQKYNQKALRDYLNNIWKPYGLELSWKQLSRYIQWKLREERNRRFREDFLSMWRNNTARPKSNSKQKAKIPTNIFEEKNPSKQNKMAAEAIAAILHKNMWIQK